MILSSEGRLSGVLSILQDSVFPSAVAPRSLVRFGDGRDYVKDELEDIWFCLDIRQLFYVPNITFRTLHSSQSNKNYGALKTPPSAILFVLGPPPPTLHLNNRENLSIKYIQQSESAKSNVFNRRVAVIKSIF